MLTNDQVKAVFGRMVSLSQDELRAVMAAKASTALELMVASVTLKCITDGDYSRLSGLLDRSVGKVKEVVENHNIDHTDEFNKVPRENILDVLRKVGNG